MKQIFLFVLLFAAVASIIMGAYMPWGKATGYIAALRNLSNVHSMDEFKIDFDQPLNYYSPVGDEEVVKFLSNDILQLVNQKGQPEPVARALVGYIETRLFQDNVRHLLTGAQMHAILWAKYHDDADYKIAEQYYLKALDIGPRLPPVLYGLMDLYRMKGDKANMERIANIIVGYWPSDESVQALLK